MGPNGAGKTTTIKIITGLSQANCGDVIIGGHSLKKDRVAALNNVGGVIEGPDTYLNMTALQNLRYFASIQGGVSEKRIREVLNLVELEERAHSKVGTYSLGMKQRLGIAQAIMHNPKLLILDEPMNGLDPAGILGMRNLLKSLCANLVTTIFTSSHILSEMQQLCTRVGIIDKGKLLSIKDMVNIEQATSEEVHVVVDNVENAIEIINKAYENLSINVDGHKLIIKTAQEQIPNITKELVLGGVMISSVSVKKQSLEDMFMQVTKKEEVL